MKKLLILSVVFLSVFIIYLSTLDRKVYVMILSTAKDASYNTNVKKLLQNKNILEKYVDEFSVEDYRVTDYVKAIKDNISIEKEGKKLTIKNSLIKADLIILDLVKNDLFNKIMYEENDEVLHNYVESIASDLDELLKLIRIYSKEDIYILEVYNPGNIYPKHIIKYMNDKIKSLAKYYKIKYIETNIEKSMIKDIIKLNEKGEKRVFEQMKEELNKSLFNK
jgi:GDSL-like Lipase/Acylhydrolase.